MQAPLPTLIFTDLQRIELILEQAVTSHLPNYHCFPTYR